MRSSKRPWLLLLGVVGLTFGSPAQAENIGAWGNGTGSGAGELGEVRFHLGAEVFFARVKRTKDQQLAAVGARRMIGTNLRVTPDGNEVTLVSDQAVQSFWKHRHAWPGKLTILVRDGTPNGKPDYYRVEFAATSQPPPDDTRDPEAYPPPINGVLCEGEVATGDLRVTDRAEVALQNARMASGKVLEVTTRGTAFTGRRSVTLEMRVNGKRVAPKFSVGPGVQRLRINLEQQGVPRFATNQRFPITCRLHPADGSSDRLDRGEMILLLPVVLVPGIDPNGEAAGGPGTWPELESYLTQQSSSLVEARAAFGTGYQLEGIYPTLYTLAYAQNRASFAEGAARLRQLVTEIRTRTYAARVNVVAHSKGGLVSRHFLADSSGPAPINHLIMGAVPNVGSVWAVISDPAQIIPYENLAPLWPWLAKTEAGPFLATPNPALEALNQRRLPRDVRYTLFYSGSWPTPMSYVKQPRAKGLHVGLTAGDLVVPAFSQLGEVVRLVAPNVPVRVTTIPAFWGIPIERVHLPGAHMGYMDSNPRVQAAISVRLLQDVR